MMQPKIKVASIVCYTLIFAGGLVTSHGQNLLPDVWANLKIYIYVNYNISKWLVLEIESITSFSNPNMLQLRQADTNQISLPVVNSML